MASTQPNTEPPSTLPPLVPRVTIQYCTQCKWMLRAAYFAQELLSTFSTDLGEVALQPATGGVFRVTLETLSSTSNPSESRSSSRLLWDRKADGGFPEVKELKRRVRDIIDPDRGLGHVDRGATKVQAERESSDATTDAERLGKASVGEESGEVGQRKEQCEDC